MSFCPVYIPVGVPTFHLESAQDQFDRSVSMLRSVNADFVCPEEMLLSIDSLRAYLADKHPDFIVFQNLTFANAAYMSEVLRRFDCPLLLWTLREPVIDGGRLRLNSLTGAYSAANTLRAFDERPFLYCFGAPEEEAVVSMVKACTAAARLKAGMKALKMAAVGHTPQGFGFGRAKNAPSTFRVPTGLSAVFPPRPKRTGTTTPVCTRPIPTMSARTTSGPLPRAAGRISSPPSVPPSARC